MEGYISCAACNVQNPATATFCMQCGASLVLQSQSVSVGRQVFMYIISALLPPFGLGWAFKYFRLKTSQAKKIAWAIVIITVVSLVLNLWILFTLYADYFKMLDQLTTVTL